MSSVDGRLLPGRWTPPFDGTSPSELFKEYAAIGKSLDTDAWMFGKATTRELHRGCLSPLTPMPIYSSLPTGCAATIFLLSSE